MCKSYVHSLFVFGEIDGVYTIFQFFLSMDNRLCPKIQSKKTAI